MYNTFIIPISDLILRFLAVDFNDRLLVIVLADSRLIECTTKMVNPYYGVIPMPTSF